MVDGSTYFKSGSVTISGQDIALTKVPALNKNFIIDATYDEVNKKVRRTLIHQEGVVIGQTVCNGNVCLKFTLLNPLITHKRIDELMLLIQKLGNA